MDKKLICDIVGQVAKAWSGSLIIVLHLFGFFDNRVTLPTIFDIASKIQTISRSKVPKFERMTLRKNWIKDG